MKRTLLHWLLRELDLLDCCRRRRYRVGFTVQGVTAFLKPHQEIRMAITMKLGQTLTLSIDYFDTETPPVPMAVPPVADAPPGWAQTTPAIMSLAVAPDSLSVVGTPLGVGSDTINLLFISGGQTFTATLDVTVEAATQVLGSVEIHAAVS